MKDDSQRLLEAFVSALHEEQRLKDRMGRAKPGTPAHDPKLWSQWLVAMKKTNQASRAFQDSLAAELHGPAP